MSIRDSNKHSWPERTAILDGAVSTNFRVRYSETDKMGVAYYAEYLVWFEVMRGDFMRAIGLPYTEMEAAGYFLPIAEANVRYLAPARYDDVVTITARLERVKSRVIAFSYRVTRENTELARGSTVHVPVDIEGKPRSLPEALLEPLRPYLA